MAGYCQGEGWQRVGESLGGRRERIRISPRGGWRAMSRALPPVHSQHRQDGPRQRGVLLPGPRVQVGRGDHAVHVNGAR
jgi:hypothetical protein